MLLILLRSPQDCSSCQAFFGELQAYRTALRSLSWLLLDPMKWYGRPLITTPVESTCRHYHDSSSPAESNLSQLHVVLHHAGAQCAALLEESSIMIESA